MVGVRLGVMCPRVEKSVMDEAGESTVVTCDDEEEVGGVASKWLK